MGTTLGVLGQPTHRPVRLRLYTVVCPLLNSATVLLHRREHLEVCRLTLVQGVAVQLLCATFIEAALEPDVATTSRFQAGLLGLLGLLRFMAFALLNGNGAT